MISLSLSPSLSLSHTLSLSLSRSHAHTHSNTDNKTVTLRSCMITLWASRHTHERRARGRTHKIINTKLTPSLPQPVKFPPETWTDAPTNSLFSGPITHLLSMLCVFGENPFTCQSKKKTKTLKGFKFRTFNYCFQVTSRLHPRARVVHTCHVINFCVRSLQKHQNEFGDAVCFHWDEGEKV